MKFKVIFILFNVVIVFSFLIIFFMPLLMLGWEYTKIFWGENWFLPILFVCIIGGLNSYFLMNWKLFQLLEQEDWVGLIQYLEDQIYRMGRFRTQHIRILVNAYLVRSRTDDITRLEDHIRQEKPDALPKYAILFGIPHILRNDPPEMEAYFSEFMEKKSPDTYWIAWCYAFALAVQRKTEQAKEVVKRFVGQFREPVLQLLYYYLIESFSADDDELAGIVERGTGELRRKYDRSAWEKEIENGRNSIQVVILSRLIDEATDWLYDESVANKGNDTIH